MEYNNRITGGLLNIGADHALVLRDVIAIVDYTTMKGREAMLRDPGVAKTGGEYRSCIVTVQGTILSPVRAQTLQRRAGAAGGGGLF